MAVRSCRTMDDLKQAIADAGGKLVVIDFYATWCGPCKVIGPQVEEMSKIMSEVMFLKVDVDENEDAAAEYNVNAMPTFVFIKENKKIDEMMGANAEKLKELVEKHA